MARGKRPCKHGWAWRSSATASLVGGCPHCLKDAQVRVIRAAKRWYGAFPSSMEPLDRYEVRIHRAVAALLELEGGREP